MRNFKELKIWQKGIDIAYKNLSIRRKLYPKKINMPSFSKWQRQAFPFLQILQKAVAGKVKKIIPGSLKFLLVLHLNWKHKL